MGKSAPQAPDPYETAAAQTGTNVSTAIANTMLGNMNQVTPDGTLTYDQTGSSQWTDPTSGSVYDLPTFTATQTLSDQQQAIKDQGDAAQLNLATLANDQSGFLGDYLGNTFSYDPGEHEKWALGLYDQLNSGAINDQRQALESRLSGQGIKLGSEAYDRALTNFGTAQQDSRNRFLLDSYGTGFNTAQAQRNQPINEITALLSGSQVSNPQYVGSNTGQVATTDLAGLINQGYANEMNAWNQKQATLGGLLGFGGKLLTGGIL